ncbi:MAG: hypothetical protein K6T65_12440 [Peptococcaceae bacterium]|nr:hypothetical protein [Peptococcaceae bacterium]
MRFERTERFKRMYKKLDVQQREIVKKALKLMAADMLHPSLRIKRVQGTKSIWEASALMYLRITFAWQGDLIILRNCGEHDSTLKNP